MRSKKCPIKSEFQGKTIPIIVENRKMLHFFTHTHKHTHTHAIIRVTTTENRFLIVQYGAICRRGVYELKEQNRCRFYCFLFLSVNFFFLFFFFFVSHLSPEPKKISTKCHDDIKLNRTQSHSFH